MAVSVAAARPERHLVDLHLPVAQEILRETGLNPALRGSRYLALAAAYAVALGDRTAKLCWGGILSWVADDCGTTWDRAERCGRHACGRVRLGVRRGDRLDWILQPTLGGTVYAIAGEIGRRERNPDAPGHAPSSPLGVTIDAFGHVYVGRRRLFAQVGADRVPVQAEMPLPAWVGGPR